MTSPQPAPFPEDDPRIEALAKCLRLERYGEIRPLWEHMTEVGRDRWRRSELHILRRLRDHHVTLLHSQPHSPTCPCTECT